MLSFYSERLFVNYISGNGGGDTLQGETEMELAIDAGEMLLKSGAETYRVGDTIKRICQKKGFDNIEVFVFPTGIIANGIYNGDRITGMKQITQRSTNLTVISRINTISRKYAAGMINAQQGLREISQLKQDCCFCKRTVFLAGIFASAAAAILLGGTWQDFVPTLIVSTLVWIVMNLKIIDLPHALKIHVAGLISGLGASVLVHEGFGLHLDKIVVGAVLPLLPGLAITSAIRDYISGDLLSGTIRTAETLLITFALASGIAAGLSSFAQF